VTNDAESGKMTAAEACRVVGIDRDRFNEHVAAGRFQCAPATIPGRARLFDPDDMAALWLFRELMDDGLDAHRAGSIACDVAACAKRNPGARAVAHTRGFAYNRTVPAGAVSEAAALCGRSSRPVTVFDTAEVRAEIARRIERLHERPRTGHHQRG
jgi:hypothetical protein